MQKVKDAIGEVITQEQEVERLRGELTRAQEKLYDARKMTMNAIADMEDSKAFIIADKHLFNHDGVLFVVNFDFEEWRMLPSEKISQL